MADTKGTPKRPVKAVVWKCDDLKALIKKQISAHVKDVDVARKLEKALSGEIAYGDGGGGNVGVA
jgi:hypothetical protein